MSAELEQAARLVVEAHEAMTGSRRALPARLRVALKRLAEVTPPRETPPPRPASPPRAIERWQETEGAY